jgi:hexosaminidase
MKILLIITAISGCLCSVGLSQTVSPLFARGYTVLPEPQKVSLGVRDFTFGHSWELKLDQGVPTNDVALQALREGLSTRFNLTLDGSGGPGGILSLRIVPESVPIADAVDHDRKSLERQAYRIDLHSGSVAITANAPTGLFYGVETLVQLLRPDKGTLWLPEGTIEDWPDLQLRSILWTDNYHLERMDALKRDIRQAAFYKINGFVLQLNGHFQYRSAPAIVEPYALSPAQLQELTDYGLHYHIQLIPYLDGPAHIAFILKHPEYAKLREFSDSNYEICATNPGSYKLLDGMFQDLLDANKGVKYFFQSTDEAYYVGLAHNSQCNEEDLARKLGSVGQVLLQFVDKADGYLHDHGRTPIFWGEYPLKPGDILSLPSYLINGEVYGPAFDNAFHKRGIKQMIFTSTEGEEPLFPNYFLLPRPHEAQSSDTELKDIVNKISFDSSRANTDLIGEVDAGWKDSGVNPETFWLGYVVSGSVGWHPGPPSIHELSSSFYSLFYGKKTVNMDHIYQLMSDQAQAWSDSWDWKPSNARKPIWGADYAIYRPRHPAHDQTLPLPPAPYSNLEYTSTWPADNARRLALVAKEKQENDILLGLLDENIQKAQFNRYNLQVYLTIADLCRQNLAMIAGIQRMDADLTVASHIVTSYDQSGLEDRTPQAALGKVDDALDIATSIWQQRNEVLKNSTATWDERWFPRVSDANGRHFLHVLNDVKDDFADRTVGLGYLVYREKILPFGAWVNSIATARNQFATAYHLPVRSYRFAWDDFNVVPAPCSPTGGTCRVSQ